MNETTSQSRRKSAWHHSPTTPIPVSPILEWPPRPLEWLKWISGYWLAISSITVLFVLAWLVYAFFQPDTEVMKQLSAGWVAQIWLRNVALLTLVAGSLHCWFYIVAGQGEKLKFDHRKLAKGSRIHTFRNQTLDNIFWSIASGVSFWTFYEAMYFWAAANEVIPTIGLLGNPTWFVVWMLLIPVWSSFHFYWIHRLLHWPPLYKIAHSVHHRNICVGPWSGISMHPVEHVIYFTSILIHFVVPSHPVHVLFHCYIQGLHPAFSHSGYEAVLVRDKKRVNSGDFFHQLHHRYFECNYGTSEMPWDKLFGSFHDGSEASTKSTRKRQRKMYAK
ncbi:MAG: sterol desaturase family protein [Rhodobacteraceae bacterium]|nr:sterol desaturase family protein [Paracoccaceae bacterium]